jgi:DNA-binding response OmpR family regulator
VARILVVEDDPAIALAVGDDLTMDGHRVEIAADGPAGARRAREEPFDLVLLDVMLPGKDGFEVCREIRRAGVATPVLMLTARAQEADKVLGLEIGADDYLTKPFGVRELRARVNALLRRSGQQAGTPVLRIGTTEVDFNRGEVKRGGETLTLTSLEFKLLDLFRRNRGRILTRDQLVAGAWGPNVFVSERVVDNHIVNLRRKIEPDPREPRYLRNLRGLGYLFDPGDLTET